MIISRILDKKTVQLMLKGLREAGLTVKKLDNGYECIAHDGTLLFRAMNGRNSYLVRMQDDLFA
tara:strand:+ start:556 stop:747 length:192 start_codon:yes stop_codon:yes gene_type:complete